MSKKDENKVIKGIYEGKYSVANLPVEVYALNYNDLIKGVEIGFGKFEFETPAFDLIKHLEANIHVFSGAKTADEVFNIQRQIFDLNGFKRPFNDFKLDAEKIYEIYNVNWLQAEHQTAIAQSRSAKQWIDIEEDKDIFPLLKYVTIGDARVRPDHALLNGIIKPVDDPFWNYSYPPNGWNCFDKETEIYTDKGWIFLKDLDKTENVLTINTENRRIEWQKPITYIKQKHNGKLVHIKANNMDIMCTKEHNLLVKKCWDRKLGRDNLKLIEAQNIGTGDQIYRGAKWDGESPEYIEIEGIKFKSKFFVKFMAWYLSDGSTTKRSENSYQIKVSQETHKDILNKDMQDCPIKWYQAKDYIGINNTKFGEYLYEIGKCNNKYIPNIIKGLSVELIRLFLDRYVICDGHKSKPQLKDNGHYSKSLNSYFSTSKRLIDDLGELILKVGCYPSFSLDKNKGKVVKFRNGEYTLNHDLWRVREIKCLYFNIFKKKHYKEVEYNDYVYCVEVEKYNTLYIRRKGRCYWSGNCRCDVEQLERGRITKLSKTQTKELRKDVDPLFRFNSGKEKVIFKEKGISQHPYFKGEGMPPKVKKVFEIEKKNKFKQLRLKFLKTQNELQERQLGN